MFRALAYLGFSLFVVMNLDATKASAEYLPPGCYVADYYRFDPCWQSNDGFSQWTEYSNRDAGASYYGGAVEAIIFAGKITEQSLAQCNADYNSLYAATNACEVNRQEWITYGTLTESLRAKMVTQLNKQLTLVSKLRKACGSKCKKIK